MQNAHQVDPLLQHAQDSFSCLYTQQFPQGKLNISCRNKMDSKIKSLQVYREKARPMITELNQKPNTYQSNRLLLTIIFDTTLFRKPLQTLLVYYISSLTRFILRGIIRKKLYLFHTALRILSIYGCALH